MRGLMLPDTGDTSADGTDLVTADEAVPADEGGGDDLLGLQSEEKGSDKIATVNYHSIGVK